MRARSSLPSPPFPLRSTVAQIDVSVNAPFSGKIIELLSAEEDTVEVGADLFILEAGEDAGGSSSGERASEGTFVLSPARD